MPVVYVPHTDVLNYNDPAARYDYAISNCVRVINSSSGYLYFSATKDYVIAAFWLSNPTSNIYGIIARSSDYIGNRFYLITPTSLFPFDVVRESSLEGYYCYISSFTAAVPLEQYVYTDFNAALQAVNDASPEPPSMKIPITYVSVGCALSGPDEASQDDNVSVIVTPESGKIIRDPLQGKSISVYNNNGYIPFTYENGTISFTVPTS